MGSSPSMAPMCTPPMPPVANTRIPAACAAIIVAATVVAPQPPDAIASAEVRPRDLAHGAARAPSRAPRAGRAVSPTSSRPSFSATVAGTAPDARTAASDAGRDLDVLRVREPVADQRGLEGDDRGAVAERVGDLGGDGEAVGGDHAR